ncbi:ABC-type metal ion transport system periplasmic component/surface adhesin [Vibrio astriarenae]|nr:ABC-type metal ion transport system periplasmic component/surface adhesin [Vibrio sp. C7]
MNLFRYLLAGLVTFSAISVAEEKPADILTSLPATYMIADQLVQDTNLVVENIAPARYGFERLPGWYDTQGAEEVAEFAQGAKAVVSLGSIWESDPIYLHTRHIISPSSMSMQVKRYCQMDKVLAP